MSLSSIGIWKGVASFIGLLGTLAFGLSQKRMNLEATGLWGIVSQLLCLTVALGSIFVAKPDLSAILLISGVIPSRIGLWVFDISVAQLFQRTVPPTVRGQVGGLQTSLNAFFEYIPFVLGMIYSDVSDFSKLVIVGYTSVGAAAALYIVGIYVPYQNGGLKYNYMPVSDLVIVDEKQSGKLQLDGRGLEENQGIHY
jgi:iron-regulated transporter 1